MDPFNLLMIKQKDYLNFLKGIVIIHSKLNNHSVVKRSSSHQQTIILERRWKRYLISQEFITFHSINGKKNQISIIQQQV
ncbi:hypothetical protein pb186bvf_006439 [Paramecium bursaria]